MLAHAALVRFYFTCFSELPHNSKWSENLVALFLELSQPGHIQQIIARSKKRNYYEIAGLHQYTACTDQFIVEIESSRLDDDGWAAADETERRFEAHSSGSIVLCGGDRLIAARIRSARHARRKDEQERDIQVAAKYIGEAPPPEI